MKKQYRRMPAEWEPQNMVQLTWPHKNTDWAPILPEITAVYEEIAREILKREDLIIVAPEDLLPQLSPLTSHLQRHLGTRPRLHHRRGGISHQPSAIRHNPSRLLLQRLGREIRGCTRQPDQSSHLRARTPQRHLRRPFGFRARRRFHRERRQGNHIYHDMLSDGAPPQPAPVATAD